MDTGMTTLPTQSDGSLGREKSDPGWAVDRDHQILLAELNVATKAIERLAKFIGVDGSTVVGASLGTVQGILRRIGWGDPSLYRWRDECLYRGGANAFEPHWSLITGAWTVTTALKGTYSAPLDGGVAQELKFQAYQFYRAAAPVMDVSVQVTEDVGTPAMRFGFIDAAGTGGYGMEFAVASSPNWRVFSLVAGVYAYADTGVPVVKDTPYRLRLWLLGAPTEQVACGSVNGTSEAIESTKKIAKTDFAPRLWVASGGAAGKLLAVGDVWLEADFSAADA